MAIAGQLPEGPVRQAISACRSHFRAIALFSALLNLLYIAPTLYMLQVYDRVLATQSGTTLLFLTLVLLLALGTLASLDYVRGRLLVRAGIRLDRMLAPLVLDATFGASRSTGSPVRELDTLRQSLTGPGTVALFDAPWTPVYILVCFMLHPWLGILAAVGTGVLLLFAWRNEASTKETLRVAGEAAARAYGTQEAAIMAAEAVRALGMRRALVALNLREREAMMNAQTAASFVSSQWSGLSRFARLTIQSLALGLGALLAINQMISAGTVFAAMFLVGRALAPIDLVIGAWKSIVQARTAYNALNNLFDDAGPSHARTSLPPPTGRLDVAGLTLAATRGETLLLDDVTFGLSPGSCLAVLGASGAGKSTLARMIAGARLPTSGVVRFDGADQRQWDPEELARYVGYLPQEVSLFEGTLRDNIARFSAELPREDVDKAVVAAAKRANAHNMITSLPDGYDYRLGPYGRGLSAGQAQRVAMARCLFGEPRYLVLDEPNAHLDSEGDLLLLASMTELKRAGTTIVMIVHRLNILPVADQVMIMQRGKLRLFGPRDEVMAQVSQTPRPRVVGGAAA